MLTKNKILAVVFGISILFISFLRENIFLEINAIIDGYTYNKAYFYFLNEHISDLSYPQLIMLKWMLSIFFLLLISVLTLLTIRLWFRSKIYNQITLFIYIFAFGLVGVITILLWVLGYYSDYYYVIRKMLGFLHSPLPLFLFFTAYLYLEKVGNKP